MGEGGWRGIGGKRGCGKVTKLILHESHIGANRFMSY